MKVLYSVLVGAVTQVYSFGGAGGYGSLLNGSVNQAWNGFCHEIDIVIPNMANPVTTVVTIVRANGTTCYTSAALAETTSTALFVDRWLDPTDMITLTLSGASGGTYTFTVTLIGE